MKIKVCGMKEPGNISSVAGLKPDMMGFIFYKSSRRYAGEVSPDIVFRLPEDIEKIGVFVNEKPDNILLTTGKYNIHTIQLHGNETPEYCRQLKHKGFKIIKAIGIGKREDLSFCVNYESCCDMLLFDTKSELYGGTGQAFDWSILKDYHGTLPFILSGGISVVDTNRIKNIDNPLLVGIDLNSRFELAPGLKDCGLLSLFIKNFRAF